MYTFSEEHKAFIQKLKKEKRIITFFRISIVLLFLLLWEILARVSILNSFLYSCPSRIFQTTYSLFQTGDLFRHIGITLMEVLVSFSIATIIGFFIAFLLWRFERLSKVLDPYITILNSLPKVALGPLIIIWVGASIHSIIFMALTISIFTTIINIYQGFITVPENYIVMIQSFGAKKRQVFQKVIFPSNVENILSTLKINISMSLIGLLPLVGEKIFFNKCYSIY